MFIALLELIYSIIDYFLIYKAIDNCPLTKIKNDTLGTTSEIKNTPLSEKPQKNTPKSVLIADEMNQMFNVGTDLKKYDNSVLKSFSKGIGYSVLTFNLSGSFNMGLMIRSALLTGCSTFYYAGKKHYDKRTTVGANHYLDIQHVSDLLSTEGVKDEPIYNYDKIREFISDKTPIFIEQGGVNYSSLKYTNIKNPLFIFGNERYGIPKELIDSCHRPDTKPIILSIPQHGVLRSYNVACALSIITSHYYGLIQQKISNL